MLWGAWVANPSVAVPSLSLGRASVGKKLKKEGRAPPASFYNLLDRGTSVEVFINPRSRYFKTLGRGMKPRPRVYKYLDRGLKKTSVEGLIKPRSRSVNLGRGLDKTSVEVIFFVFAEIRLPKSVTQVHGFTLHIYWFVFEKE